MVKLKVIASLLLIALVACNLTDLAGVNITFTTTSDLQAGAVTPAVAVSAATPPSFASTVTPDVATSPATPASEANLATPTAAAQRMDSAVEAENISTVATRRAAELLQYTQNVHALLGEIRNGQVAQPGPLNKLNDLNNDLADLWLKISGDGLGADPYLDNIKISSTGFSRPEPPSSYGITGPYTFWGLPRLYERRVELLHPAEEATSKQTAFAHLVQAYSNPARYPHRDFYERAYASYRLGQELSSAQYLADLEALDQWLSALESVLNQIPSYFAN